MMRRLPSSLILAAAFAGRVCSDSLPPGYSIRTISPPKDTATSVSGISFQGRDIYLCTREGDVWQVAGGGIWRRFASGLHEPMGVLPAPGQPAYGEVRGFRRVVYVLQRDELTRLVDEDDDGEADWYETVSDAWGVSGNYHEYAFGPVMDAAGALYGALGLTDSLVSDVNAPGGGQAPKAWDVGRVGGSPTGRAAKWRGWAFQVRPDGAFLPWCSGLRAPSGVGMSPDGELFCTEPRGDWMGPASLRHLVKGSFQGHPAALLDDERFSQRDLNAVSVAELEKLRMPPAVVFPAEDLANAPGQPAWDTTAGAFGPFAGQIFVGDQSKARLMRVALEKVGEVWQGAVFNFIEPLHSGVIRAAFGPDHGLWLGESGRGWSTVGGRPFGFERIRWDGKTVPFELHSIHAVSRGFRIDFTRAAGAEAAGRPENYVVRHWRPRYQAKADATPDDLTEFKPAHVEVSADGKSVSLDAPIAQGRVYEITVKVAAADGDALTNPTGWYTVNRLP